MTHCSDRCIATTHFHTYHCVRDTPADSHRHIAEESVVAPFNEVLEVPDGFFFFPNREKRDEELFCCFVSFVCCVEVLLPFVILERKPLEFVVVLVKLVLLLIVADVSSLLLLMPEPAEA